MEDSRPSRTFKVFHPWITGEEEEDLEDREEDSETNSGEEDRGEDFRETIDTSETTEDSTGKGTGIEATSEMIGGGTIGEGTGEMTPGRQETSRTKQAGAQTLQVLDRDWVLQGGGAMQVPSSSPQLNPPYLPL